MSDRSLFPAGVEVHQRHLIYESEFRSTQAKQVLTNSSELGTLTGLVVSVNTSDVTKIDISAGSGYVPNGELATLTAGVTGMLLASNTLGTVNYVLLVYDEIQSQPESHEADGTTLNTKATGQSRLVILTAADYAALPASNSVLSSNAVDRALILAKVTATGGALSSANIELPTAFNSVLTATQPSTISGLSILSVDQTSTLGIGTITYTAASHQLQWAEHGDTAGVAVTVSTSGAVTISSNNGHSIVVYVTYSQLPSINTSASVTIGNIYSQSIPRFTSVDSQHRAKLGSGVPTNTNPHGMTLDDLSPGVSGTLEEHQDLMHANGIIIGSSAGLLSGAVNTAAAPDTVVVSGFTTGDLVYINGKRINAIVGSNVITFTDGIAGPGTYGIYLGQDGTLYKQILTAFTTSGAISTSLQVVNMSYGISTVTTSHTITLTVSNTLKLNSGPEIAVPTIDQIIRLYDTDNINYIDCYVKSTLTGGLTSDDIQVTAAPNIEEALTVCYAPWSGLASGFVGYGFGTANAPNSLFDKRVYGTLSKEQTRTDAGMIDAAKMVTEVLGDGLVISPMIRPGTTNGQYSFANAYAIQHQLTAAYPNASYSGGVCYVNGNRYEVPATAALAATASAVNRVYINRTGAITISTNSWDQIAAAQLGDQYLRIGEFTVGAGPGYAISGIFDERVFIGQKRNIENGVFALDANKSLDLTTGVASGYGFTIRSSTATAIAGISSGAGGGLYGESSSGVAVSGISSTGTGTRGQSTSSAGVAGISTSSYGVYGVSTSGTGVYGTSTNGLGVYGYSANGDAIVGQAVVGRGIAAISSSGSGIEGSSGTGAGGKFSSTSGVAVEIGTGNCKYTAANPLAGDAFSNYQTPRNLIKSWGTFTVADAATYSATDGFNINTTIAHSGVSTYNITISFATGGGMASGVYVVIPTIEYTTISLAAIRVVSKAAGSFVLQVYALDTGGAFTRTQQAGTIISFIIVGIQ